MNHQQAYNDLLSHLKRTAALSQVAGLISWDQETMMPKEGAEARAEQSATMAAVIHEKNTDPRMGEWCEQIDETMLDDVARANVREAKRTFQRGTLIPASLVEDMARQSALGQGIWANARLSENVADFLPTLREMVELKRQESACLSATGDDPYDALLDDYEPGMKTSDLTDLLGRLRPGLIALREKIDAASVEIRPIKGSFDAKAQMEMARRLAKVFNYRFQAGRIDKAVHPFSSGYRGDARITTRINTENVFDCMYSTIHEVGHANYEQGRDPAMDCMPAGGYASMGMHESQSRMLENQIGRSRAFMQWLYPQMCEVFGDIGISSPDELFAVINKVEPGFIRTEADEVHYNLHVLLRFDLERAMISGDLHVTDLEAAWNDRFEADFGRKVDRPSNGVLQDVHWSCGLFGYFPTYSLGNIYAGELFAKMSADIPDIDRTIASGELTPLSEWLRNTIHRSGHVYSAARLMQHVTGKHSDIKALNSYLDAKFDFLCR